MTRVIVLFVALLASALSMAKPISVPLGEAKGSLIPIDWSIVYAQSQYRDLIIRYDQGRTQARWTEVMEEAGQRYGVAVLLDMENKVAIIVPSSDGVRRGLHYVLTRVDEQARRYQWGKWMSEANKEADSFEFEKSQQLRASEIAQADANRREVTRRSDIIESKYDKKVAENQRILESNINMNNAMLNRNIDENNRQAAAQRKAMDAELARLRSDLAQSKALFEDRKRRMEESKVKFDIAKREYDVLRQATEADKVVTLAEQTALAEQRLQLEEEEKALATQVSQNSAALIEAKADMELKMAAYQKQLDEQYMTRAKQLADDEQRIAKLKSAYYPDAARTLHAGKASKVIEQFLNTYWQYNLSWSDNLLTQQRASQLNFTYPLHFDEVDLGVDVSKIVCTLTRDVPGISIYAEIDDVSRLVIMQIHSSTEPVRKRILAQCYN